MLFLIGKRVSGPGVKSEELEPWQEAGETWRRLKVRLPTDIATHMAGVFESVSLETMPGLKEFFRLPYRSRSRARPVEVRSETFDLKSRRASAPQSQS
jgi:hypothetical protein